MALSARWTFPYQEVVAMDKLLSGRRVLVVEDEVLVRVMIEDMLADLKFRSDVLGLGSTSQKFQKRSSDAVAREQECCGSARPIALALLGLTPGSNLDSGSMIAGTHY
jgi:hypothetical protein